MTRRRQLSIRAVVALLLVASGCQRNHQPPPAGIVVTELADRSWLESAGLRHGDVLLSWNRPPNPPTSPQRAQGVFSSTFSWHSLVSEDAWRGPIQLHGERDGTPFELSVGAGEWSAEVWPRASEAVLNLSRRATELAAQNEMENASMEWSRAAKAAGTPSVQAWARLEMAKTRARGQLWDQALEAYHLALSEAPEIEAQVVIRSSIASFHVGRSQFEDARRELEEAQEIAKETWGDSLRLASLENELGVVAWYHGDIDRAERQYLRALDIGNRFAPENVKTAEWQNNLAVALANRGELEAADQSYRQILTVLTSETPDSLIISHVLNNLASVAIRRGEPTKAEESYRRSLELRRRLAPGSRFIAESLSNLGRALEAQGKIDEARNYHEEALQIIEQVAPGTTHVAFSLSELGRIAQLEDDQERAEGFHQRALAIRETVSPGSLKEAISLYHLGKIAQDRRQFDQADRLYRRALAIREQLAPSSAALAELLHALGELARERGDRTAARQNLARALEVLEEQIGRLGGSHDVKGGFRAQYGHLYQDAIDLEVQLGNYEQALLLVERSRARSFLAMLNERELLFSIDVPEELEQDRVRLRTQHDRTVRRLASLDPTADEERTRKLLEQQQGLRNEIERIGTKIRQTAPRLAELQNPRPLNLAEIERTLDPGTAMLSYAVGDSSTHLFVVRSGYGLEAVTIDVGEEQLRDQIEQFLALVEAVRSSDEPRMTALAASGKRLYELLLGPVENLLDQSERLLVLPDGPLHHLPFAALVRSQPGTVGRTSPLQPQYLIEWKPIHQVLSATVYAELVKTREQALATDGLTTTALIAFGDPHYPRSLTESSTADATVRSVASRDPDRFNALPHTRWEVEQIAALFPSDSARVFLGRQATEEQAKSIGTRAKTLHFATHGILDERAPLNSALALTIPDELGDAENGLLQAWEIFEQVRLNSDLVVLSACRTGLGRQLGGEGLIGLTRAFQYAGARTVAATLWDVSDRAAAQLMVRFYRHLQDGLSKDEALRQAQIELIRGDQSAVADEPRASADSNAAPYYWAAFQLYGDWR